MPQAIFNLYRAAVTAEARIAEPERFTNVLGGAFMPAVSADGAIAYAHYQWDGYKIARLDAVPAMPPEAQVAAYTPPSITQKQANLRRS